MSKETLIEELKVKLGCSRDAAEELFDAGSASRDTEIESLRQQLDGWIAANSPNGWIDNLRQQLSDSQKQVTMLRDALDEAATSLETIQLRSHGDESYLNHMDQVRGYAGSRAVVARVALAATEPKP